MKLGFGASGVRSLGFYPEATGEGGPYGAIGEAALRRMPEFDIRRNTLRYSALRGLKEIKMGKITLFLGSIIVATLLSIPRQSNDLATRLSSLIKANESNSLIQIKRLTEKSWSYVYVLHPYQIRISTDCPESKKINEKIQQFGLNLDESRWALLFLKGNEVEIIAYNRSDKIDIFSKNELISASSIQIPKNFKPNDCVHFNESAFFSFNLNSRRYLTLGEQLQ